jgi:hypothetical protein
MGYNRSGTRRKEKLKRAKKDRQRALAKAAKEAAAAAPPAK